MGDVDGGQQAKGISLVKCWLASFATKWGITACWYLRFFNACSDLRSVAAHLTVGIA